MSFALITGASRGIGRAIALEFAARGKDVLLVSRDGERLRQTCDEIQQLHKIKAHYLVCDLAADDAAAHVFTWCQSNHYSVDVLVNNAGYGLSGRFEQHGVEQHTDMLHVNILTPVQLIHLFLPILKQQDRGYILNIASTSAYQATPFLGLYAASKAFLVLFSRSLHIELRSSTVSVTCISPGSTDTAFNDRAMIGKKARDMAKKVNMQPGKVAAVAVDAMYKGKTEVVIGLLNKVGVFFAWLLPKKLVENAAARIYQ
ncbi:MAG TPA: SDR family oxidoreductase [Flavisolibacter sp.]